MTSDKKALMRKIINCFENGTLKANYHSVYVYADGPGDRRQITQGFGITEYGNLKKLIQIYINDGGKYAKEFSKYVSKIGSTPLVDNKEFKALLVAAALEDEIYRKAQDKVFEDKYFTPALEFALENGIVTDLGVMVLLDSFIHSGSIPTFLRTRFEAKTPTNGGDEKEWIKQYVNVRHSWLANHSRKILRGTIYRTQFFKTQIANGNWDLNPPVVANGVKISS